MDQTDHDYLCRALERCKLTNEASPIHIFADCQEPNAFVSIDFVAHFISFHRLRKREMI